MALDPEARSTSVTAGSRAGGERPPCELVPFSWAIYNALDVDDGTWNRARGFALHQAAMIIPYYAETNPGFVVLAKRTVEEVLAD